MDSFEDIAGNLINLISDTTREANESMIGYYYQIDHTLLSILTKISANI